MRYKSNLFIPGHTLDRLDRGLNSNASALIIDLEDGCPEDKKIDAREELIGLLKKGNVFTKPLFVRVNDAMNENGRQDIDALSDFEEQIEAIILPKTQSFDFLATLAPMIAFENKLVPLIETPRAVDTVTQIAAFKGVIGLFFGAADFSAGMGSKLAWEPLLYARHKVALAAAMYNLFTIDAPFFYIDNEEGLKAEEEVWEPWLSKQDGFLGRQIFYNKKKGEALLLVKWENRKLWKSISDEEVNKMQEIYEETVTSTLGIETNPFKFIYEGELFEQK